MKKSIMIFWTVLATLSLTAFTYVNWSDPIADQEETSCSKAVVFDNDLVNIFNKQDDLDLVYNVDSRYINTITKEKLDEAKSIIDILPRKATQSALMFYAVRVSILHDSEETDQRENGFNEMLTAAQVKLLHSTDYSTEFFIGASYKQMNGETRELTYYMSILPEKEAEFINGQEALIEYLRENSKEETAFIKKDKLQPGKVSFTVTQKGTIANVELTSTSGYPSVDKALVELISNMPGKWNPATNSKGEKVDQELVFFFGLEGC